MGFFWVRYGVRMCLVGSVGVVTMMVISSGIVLFHLQLRSVNILSFMILWRTVAATSKILVSHRFLQKLLEKRFKGFFGTLPGGKKCALRVGTECGLYSIHAASSAAVHVTCHGHGDLGEW